jgi:hypothetical protein
MVSYRPDRDLYEWLRGQAFTGHVSIQSIVNDAVERLRAAKECDFELPDVGTLTPDSRWVDLNEVQAFRTNGGDYAPEDVAIVFRANAYVRGEA